MLEKQESLNNIVINRGSLIIFSGSSGVGKNTILNKLFDIESLNLKYSISMTTREKRQDEVHGVNYFFINEEEFKENINNNNFLEWKTYVNNFYGTPKKSVIKFLEEGFNVLLEIEPKGALEIMKNWNEEYISFFIMPPSMEELERRLINRKTENRDEISKRIKEAQWECSQSRNYQNVLINDDVDNVVNLISKIIGTK